MEIAYLSNMGGPIFKNPFTYLWMNMNEAAFSNN